MRQQRSLPKVLPPLGRSLSQSKVLKGARFSQIDILGSTQLNPQSDLPSVLKGGVKASLSQLYSDYEGSKSKIAKQVLTIKSKQGVESELRFMHMQKEAQKHYLDNLLTKIKSQEQVLQGLKLRLVYGESPPLQQYQKLLKEQQQLEQSLNQQQYEFAVTQDMSQFRLKVAEEAADLASHKKQLLDLLKQKIRQLLVNKESLEDKLTQLQVKREVEKEQAFGKQEVNKLRDDFKENLQHELQELSGKTALREIIAHQEQLLKGAVQADRQMRQREKLMAWQKKQQQLIKQTQAKLKVEDKLQELQSKFQLVRKKTTVGNIQEFRQQCDRQDGRQQILREVGDQLVKIRDQMRKKCQQIGSVFDARNVEIKQMADPNRLLILQKQQQRIRVKLDRLDKILVKGSMLSSKMQAMSGQVESDSAELIAKVLRENSRLIKSRLSLVE